MSGQREDYLTEEQFEVMKNYLIENRSKLNVSDDDFYMTLALLVSNCSRDPSSQVGAVVISKTGNITYGYNQAPRGMNDDDVPWDSLGEETDDKLHIKNYYVVHAEAAAILKQDISNCDGATLYVTWSPCNECAKLIAMSGIKRVVYHRPYSNDIINIITSQIINSAGASIQSYMGDEEDVINKKEQNHQRKCLVKMIKHKMDGDL